MPGFRISPSRRARAAVGIAAATILIAPGCSNRQRLAEYDFRGRTLTVVTIAPPHPEVFSGASLRGVDTDNALGMLIRVGAEIAREAGAEQAREKLDRAAEEVDVADRMGARVLDNAARHLRARPVVETPAADYELELRVRSYGIVAASWTADAHFLIDSEVRLLDGRTGRRIWTTDVRARDPVRASVVGVDDRSVSNVISAAKLASMSEEEIRRALESLADFAADAVIAELAESLDDVRG